MRPARNLFRADELLELAAQVFLAGGERLAGAAEHGLGQFGSAEGGEAREAVLLVRGCGSVLALQVLQQADGRKVVDRLPFQVSARVRWPFSRQFFAGGRKVAATGAASGSSSSKAGGLTLSAPSVKPELMAVVSNRLSSES